MMQFQPLDTRRLYRQIADQIRDLLASGRYPLGSRLPPERDLAAQLHVSRTSVREAIIALELAGLIEVRVGSGIYVSRIPDARQLLFEAGAPATGPLEILKAQRMLESEVAAEAAASVDEASLGALTEAVEGMERTRVGSRAHAEADRLFHVRIATATHNGALIQMVRRFWDLRSGPLWRKLERRFQSNALRASVLADHREILQALRAHAVTDARQVMSRHIESMEREFVESVLSPTPEPQIAVERAPEAEADESGTRGRC
ncbi:MAG TPA: GntR family transcriptional regulator [Polyangia bacterium]|nr:GntR family transcriptional regulator [Polyangia bacterium]